MTGSWQQKQRQTHLYPEASLCFGKSCGCQATAARPEGWRGVGTGSLDGVGSVAGTGSAHPPPCMLPPLGGDQGTVVPLCTRKETPQWHQLSPRVVADALNG